MAISRATAKQIMEQQTMGSDARLRQDNYERREERLNWTALGLFVVALLVLGLASYVWYTGTYSFGNTIKPANSMMMVHLNNATQPTQNQ